MKTPTIIFKKIFSSTRHGRKSFLSIAIINFKIMIMSLGNLDLRLSVKIYSTKLTFVICLKRPLQNPSNIDLNFYVMGALIMTSIKHEEVVLILAENKPWPSWTLVIYHNHSTIRWALVEWWRQMTHDKDISGLIPMRVQNFFPICSTDVVG